MSFVWFLAGVVVTLFVIAGIAYHYLKDFKIFR